MKKRRRKNRNYENQLCAFSISVFLHELGNMFVMCNVSLKWQIFWRLLLGDFKVKLCICNTDFENYTANDIFTAFFPMYLISIGRLQSQVSM